MLHAELVGFLIALNAWSVDGGSLGSIEDTELNPRNVRADSHFPAEGIDFANDMSLRLPTNCGITAHLRDGVVIPGEQERAGPQAGSGKCGLDASMPCSANYDIVGLVGVKTHTFFRKHDENFGLKGKDCFAEWHISFSNQVGMGIYG
jgi:hypothetical protein